MGHKHPLSFHLKKSTFFKLIMQAKTVAIAPYCTHLLPRPEFLQHSRSNVTCMPQLITVLEKIIDLSGNHPMSVAQNPYTSHNLLYFPSPSFISMYFLKVLANHLLQIVDDVDIVHRHAIQSLLQFIRVKHKFILISTIGDNKVDVLVSR